MTAPAAAPRNGLDRAAIIVVPAAAGLAVALTLLGAGRAQPAVGARAYGLPIEGASPWSLRVETVQTERPLPPAHCDVPLRVELRCGDSATEIWTGRSGGSGIAEVTLPAPKPASSAGPAVPCHVAIRSAELLLGAGEVRPAPRPTPRREAPLDGASDGPIALQVSLPRGVAVATLEERIEVLAELPPPSGGSTSRPCPPGATEPAGEAGASPLSLELRARGATVRPAAPPTRWSCSDERPRLEASALLVAEAPPVELEVVARTTDGDVSTWRGELPVVLGWAWASERAAAEGRLLVRSVSAAPRLYASLVGSAGRFWGDVLTLTPDADGLTTAERPLPALPEGPIVLRLSSDPAEPSPTAAPWPLRPALGSLAGTELRLLLDGLPAAQQREQRRQVRARLPAVGFVAAAGLFELVYLLRRYRLSRQRALRTLADIDRPDSTRGRLVAPVGLLWLAVLGGGVALAFAALAALALWG